MTVEDLRSVLGDVAAGRRSIDDALHVLGQIPIADLGFAQIDTHRPWRLGLPEAIYAEHKTPQHVVEIAERMMAATTAPVIATRVAPEATALLQERFPDGTFFDLARLAVLRAAPLDPSLGTVAVVCAGTSDLAVAEEAAETLGALGIATTRINDAGIAGIHRILAHQDSLRTVDVVIAVAGMEGALPTLLGGITPAPIVAVPTSVGYGSAFEGLSALLTMLNSCAAGVVVTNIDNGFGAACCAARILKHRGATS